jgi:hypothetical protein
VNVRVLCCGIAIYRYITLSLIMILLLIDAAVVKLNVVPPDI